MVFINYYFFCLLLVKFTSYSVMACTGCLTLEPVPIYNHGLSDFAKEFYWECAQSKPGNMIISPLSVSTALSLLSQAAGASTFEELKNGLHLNGDKNIIAKQSSDHFELLQRNIGASTLSIANKIYVQQGHQLNKSFEEAAVKYFKSGVESLDFAKSEESAQTINQFVEEKTNGKIKELFKPDMITSDTRSILVNAIYFKGRWEIPFEIRATRKKNFYTSETDNVSVDFMHTNDRFKVAFSLDDIDASALEMKFADSTFSFVIILPKSRTGLRALERKLKDYELPNIVENMRQERVFLDVPKFTVEFEIKLNDVLQKLGMREMFSKNADLGGIFESGEQLLVSDVIHKAFIEVSEEGAEAAGGTGVKMVPASMPPQFTVDHPFLYFIRETETNTVVFSGRVETLG